MPKSNRTKTFTSTPIAKKVVAEKTAVRKPPTKTVMERLYLANGEKWIVKQYKNALENSTKVKHCITKQEFYDVYPSLRKNRARGFGKFLNKKGAWRKFKELNFDEKPCMIHTGGRANGYPTVSTRTLGGSQHLQLHQVPHYIRNGWSFQDYNSKSSSNHRCHNKLCLVHAHMSSKATNIGQNYCMAVMIVGFRLVKCCPHRPRCLRPGKLAFPDSDSDSSD